VFEDDEKYVALQDAAEFVQKHPMTSTPAHIKAENNQKRKPENRKNDHAATSLTKRKKAGEEPTLAQQARAMRIAARKPKNALDKKRYESAGLVLAALKIDPNWTYELDEESAEDDSESESESKSESESDSE
jgi:hypothetical protein